jgi:hypothetical protein
MKLTIVVYRCWRLWIYGKSTLASSVCRASPSSIGGGTSEILKEILSKMIIDNKDHKPAVKKSSFTQNKKIALNNRGNCIV